MTLQLAIQILSPDHEAVILYRRGELSESRTLLTSLLYESTGDERLSISNWLAKVERAALDNKQAILHHTYAEPLVSQSSSPFLIGNYHLGFGNSRRIQGRIDDALRHYTEALHHFMDCHDYDDWAITENNIAYILLDTDPDGALDHLFTARDFLLGLDLPHRLAIVHDTLAQAYLKLNQIEQAFYYSSRSVSELIGSGEELLLRDSKRTMNKIMNEL